MPTTVVISRPALDRLAVNGGRSGRSRAGVQMAADRFWTHTVRVDEGEQRDSHPQHAQRTR
ncbi:hypothetical protein QMK30_21695 [Streptomyces sp. H27-C3]|nr:hypothetical protein [Streptomyces sp. H27-C3]